MFLEVPGQGEMTSNGKNKALESKICVLGSTGVGKSGKLFCHKASLLSSDMTSCGENRIER